MLGRVLRPLTRIGPPTMRLQLKALAVATALLAAEGPASAAPSVGIASAGNCASAELSSFTSGASGRLSERQPGTFVSMEELSERLRPSAPKSAEALMADLETARSAFFETDYLRARTQVEEVLKRAPFLPPGPERWKVTRNGWLLHGLILRSEQPNSTAHESSFRQVLRIDPRDAMDPTNFSPNTRSTYDHVRKAVARSQKLKLEVQADLPGAEIFLDGFMIGKSPAVLSLPPGEYQLHVARGTSVSFPHTVALIGRPQSVKIDLAREGTALARPVPCIARAAESDQLAAAATLGQRVGVEKLILLRLETQENGPAWLTALQVNTANGQRIREGGIKVAAASASSQELDDLITFVLTGEPRRSVVSAEPESIPPWLRTEDPRGMKSRRIMRWSAYGAAGVAVIAGAASLGTYLQAKSTQRRLQSHLSAEGFAVEGDAKAQELARSVHSKQALSTGLLIVAGAAAAASGTLWYFSRPTFAKRVTVTAGTTPALDGGQLSMQGAF